MQNRDTKVSELCQEFGVTRSTLYLAVSDHTVSYASMVSVSSASAKALRP